MACTEEDRGANERPSRVVVLRINGNKRGAIPFDTGQAASPRDIRRDMFDAL